MKSLLIKVAIFLVGGGAGFFAGKKVYESYYANISQAEIDSVKDIFERRRDQYEEMIEKLNGKSSPDADSGESTTTNVVNVIHNMSRSSIEKGQERPKKAYNLVRPATNSEEEEGESTDEGDITESEARDLTEVNRTAPYIISAEEFSNEFDHHDKISLYYYREDDILCEENEEIIENAEDIVGEDALLELTESIHVWVRNEPLAIDYEIVALNGSYAQMIGAKNMPRAILTPREEHMKRQREKEMKSGE